MTRLIIAGGRDFNNFQLLKSQVDEYIKSHHIDRSKLEIISGKARGADTLGELYATINQLPVKVFPANWLRYGKRAGFIRNTEMANYATHCICFWDNKSSGTKHMINTAREFGLQVKVVYYNRPLSSY